MAVFSDAEWRADLAMVADATRRAAREFAQDVLQLASLAERVPAPVGTGAGAVAWQSFVREIAVAKGVGERTAARQLAVAELLTNHLGRTLESLACGSTTVLQATTLAEELIGVDPAVAHHVDRELNLSLQAMSRERIKRAVSRAVDRLDADAAADRAAKAATVRAIRCAPERDGQASAYVNGPAVSLTRWFTALTEAARQQQAAGDPRGLDALRFDLLVAGFTSEDGTPEPAPLPVAPEPAAPTRIAPPADPFESSGTGEPEADLAEVGAHRLLWQARAQAERVLEAAHAAEAEAHARLLRARSEADRLTAQTIRDRLTRSYQTPDDRRSVRPVQLLIHVPVTTALGLDNEPGWLEGHGWVSAPECRQLMPVAELRQVCTTAAGQVVDLAPRAVRPEPTPQGVREALLAMASEPFEITKAAWSTVDQHDPPTSMADLVRLRDRGCDGPLGASASATRVDLDHQHAHPDGPTAAWNLAARRRRTHRLKHRGWIPCRTGTGTLWTSPAGQVVLVPRHQPPLPTIAPTAVLPEADELHALEGEQLRPPTPDDEPPF